VVIADNEFIELNDIMYAEKTVRMKRGRRGLLIDSIVGDVAVAVRD